MGDGNTKQVLNLSKTLACPILKVSSCLALLIPMKNWIVFLVDVNANQIGMVIGEVGGSSAEPAGGA